MDPPAKRQRTSKYDTYPRSVHYGSPHHRDATPTSGEAMYKEPSNPQEPLLAREHRSSKRTMGSKHRLLHRRQASTAPDLVVTIPSATVAVKLQIHAVLDANSTAATISPPESSFPALSNDITTSTGVISSVAASSPTQERSLTAGSSSAASSVVSSSSSNPTTVPAIVIVNESSQVVLSAPPSTPLPSTATPAPGISASAGSSRINSLASTSPPSESSASSAPTSSSSATSAPTSRSHSSGSTSSIHPTPIVVSAAGRPSVTISPSVFTSGDLTIAGRSCSCSRPAMLC